MPGFWLKDEQGGVTECSSHLRLFITHTPSVVATGLTGGAKLVGIDTLNAADWRDLARPAQRRLPHADVLILENLTGFDALYGNNFRLFAVPLMVTGAAAMTVRAFAEINHPSSAPPL